MTGPPKKGFRLLGLGAVACVACCVGPIVVFLGGLGVVGLASVLYVGAAGLVVAALAVAAIVVIRRRPSACASRDLDLGPVPVPVAAPMARSTPPSREERR